MRFISTRYTIPPMGHIIRYLFIDIQHRMPRSFVLYREWPNYSKHKKPPIFLNYPNENYTHTNPMSNLGPLSPHVLY